MEMLDLSTAIDLGQAAVLIGIFYRLGGVTAQMESLKTRLSRLERVFE